MTIKLRSIGTGISGLLLFLFLAGTAPGAARAAAEASAPEVAAMPSAPARTAPEEVNRNQLRYAQREAKSPESATFKGGHAGVYIGGSAVAVVLLVVLLIVLL